MKITPIEAGMFKLDGGAMFGVVPKTLWSKLNPPDEDNLCTWALRCLLIEVGHRKILVDTGIGMKQDEKFRSHFKPHGDKNLLGSLAAAGIQPEDISDVFLTHLHFDHCGGAVSRSPEGDLYPTFPKATYWSNLTHYRWALEPNAREAASFLRENFVPLQEQNKLEFIPPNEGEELAPGVEIGFSFGHTEAMMPLYIRAGNRTVVYCADLLPSSFHIGMPYVMGYDIRPLVTLEEKKQLFNRIVEENGILFFEHDPVSEAATLLRDEKGRIVPGQRGTLSELLS